MTMHPRFRFLRFADEFLATDQGQWALRHGCGLAAWERVAETGKKRFEPNELRAIYNKVQANDAALAAASTPVMLALAHHWQARMERERELAERYLNGAAA